MSDLAKEIGDFLETVEGFDILKKVQSELPPEATIYVVGGAMRDLVSGKSKNVNDIDCIAEGIKTKKELGDLLAEYGKVEINRMGAFRWWPNGCSMKYGIFRADDSIFLQGKEPTIENALASFDLNINAIGYNIRTGEIVDPVGGIKAVQDGEIDILRNTQSGQEPARVLLRAIKYTVKTGFDLTEKGIKWIVLNARQLNKLRPEDVKRVLEGIEKYDHTNRFGQFYKKYLHKLLTTETERKFLLSEPDFCSLFSMFDSLSIDHSVFHDWTVSEIIKEPNDDTYFDYRGLLAIAGCYFRARQTEVNSVNRVIATFKKLKLDEQDFSCLVRTEINTDLTQHEIDIYFESPRKIFTLDLDSLREVKLLMNNDFDMLDETIRIVNKRVKYILQKGDTRVEFAFDNPTYYPKKGFSTKDYEIEIEFLGGNVDDLKLFNKFLLRYKSLIPTTIPKKDRGLCHAYGYPIKVENSQP